MERDHSSGFQVPDEIDSPSDLSREGSIQIVESHPRSFSYLSSDEETESDDSDVESIEIASSVAYEREKNSAATTPDQMNSNQDMDVIDLVDPNPKEIDLMLKEHEKQKRSFRAENPKDITVPLIDLAEDDIPAKNTRGPNLKGPRITEVLSKATPADHMAVGSSQENFIDIDDESLCEYGIESDSDGPDVLPISYASSKPQNGFKSGEPQPTQKRYPTPTVIDKEMGYDNEAQLIDEKDEDEEAELPQKPWLSFNDDGIDDDGFDNEDGFPLGLEEVSTEDLNDLDMTERRPTAVKGRLPSEAKKAQATTQNLSVHSQSSNPRSCPNVTMSNGINVSQAPATSYAPLGPPLPVYRAPSPSDAALARNCGVAYGNTSLPGPGIYTPWGSRPGNGVVQDSMDSIGSTYVNGPQGSLPHTMNVNTHSKPYVQGPFAKWNQSLPGPQAPPFAQNVCSASSNSWSTLPNMPSVYHDIASDARYAAQLQAQEDALAVGLGPSTHNPPATSEKESRKGSDGQSSKIDIADLVNTGHTESVRPVKRKADEISTSMDKAYQGPMVVVPRKTQDIRQPQSSTSYQASKTQETQLPDAQPRDTLPVPETNSLGEESPLDHVDETNSAPFEEVAAETGEPARKKAKTSSSSSPGIGKFVSGVCVGLATAFAAFIATIPASVQEEALREMSNAV